MSMITYYYLHKWFSDLQIRMCMSISNRRHGSVLFKNDENTYQKGRAIMQMYRVVHQTKRDVNTKKIVSWFKLA